MCNFCVYFLIWTATDCLAKSTIEEAKSTECLHKAPAIKLNFYMTGVTLSKTPVNILPPIWNIEDPICIFLKGLL